MFQASILGLKKEIQEWKDIAETNSNANTSACETVYYLRNQRDELLKALQGLYDFNLDGTGYLDIALNQAESAIKKITE